MELNQLVGFPVVDTAAWLRQTATNSPSFSTDNDVIPVDAFRSCTKYQAEGRKLLLYENIFKPDGTYTGRMGEFCDQLLFHPNIENPFLSYRKIRHAQIESDRFYAFPGKVMDVRIDPMTEHPVTFTPLMLLGVKRRYVFDVRPDNIKSEYFCLVVDNKFKNDEECFKVYRNVNRAYIEPAQNLIDVVYTNDIMGMCYKGVDLSIPAFNTMEDMARYISQVNAVLFDFIKHNDG